MAIMGVNEFGVGASSFGNLHQNDQSIQPGMYIVSLYGPRDTTVIYAQSRHWSSDVYSGESIDTILRVKHRLEPFWSLDDDNNDGKLSMARGQQKTQVNIGGTSSGAGEANAQPKKRKMSSRVVKKSVKDLFPMLTTRTTPKVLVEAMASFMDEQKHVV
ncbi:hypothetical protein DH2020_043023 [Rehmannia glutinosa]|uniref:Uncharacterized protein n=1 Tax=Rehmannia glutinosa TaxID=99300 RepID=A0ABR0ULJ9_REHGL